jgi:hypothetical protein
MTSHFRKHSPQGVSATRYDLTACSRPLSFNRPRCAKPRRAGHEDILLPPHGSKRGQFMRQATDPRTNAQRKQQAERMQAFWAVKKKAAAKRPQMAASKRKSKAAKAV